MAWDGREPGLLEFLRLSDVWLTARRVGDTWPHIDWRVRCALLQRQRAATAAAASTEACGPLVRGVARLDYCNDVAVRDESGWNRVSGERWRWNLRLVHEMNSKQAEQQQQQQPLQVISPWGVHLYVALADQLCMENTAFDTVMPRMGLVAIA